MSSSIWTRCAGASRLRTLALEPWRAVESQHQVATRRLVDTAAEQAVLEDLIESAKPPDVAGARYHYLLSTLFRYPPLPHGSRFGTRFQLGLWYGSESIRTTFAETAYYRLLFLEGTRADLGTLQLSVTLFSVRVRTPRGIDLTRPPFDLHRKALASKTRYGPTQRLGTAMRGADVEVARYLSARDVEGGVNVAIFAPQAFGRSRPRQFQNWYCTANREHVEMNARDYFERRTFSFRRGDFLVRGSLPRPAQ